jgi:hypothetical protein
LLDVIQVLSVRSLGFAGGTPLWNTIYIEAVLNQLRAEGFPVRDEDVALMSPLLCPHINMMGRYSFSIPAVVAKGELRPLRDPADGY